jgi:hypothetical protein
MAVKYNGINTSVPVRKLRDGQMAIITKWDCMDAYAGRVVQRVGDSLITVGSNRSNSWPELFSSNSMAIDKKKDGIYMVDVLPEGAVLTVSSN